MQIEYAAYCANQELATDVLEHCTDHVYGFADFVAGASQRSLGGLSLHSYLLKPFQRITKYPLLLRELLKVTPGA